MKLFCLFILPYLLNAATVTVCTTGCTDVPANLQAQIDARACGDHVQLKAQAAVYPKFYLPGGTSRQCAGNPIYIENFAMAALPASGVLVTPPYAPLMPYVQTSSNEVMLARNGNVDCGGGGAAACPANGWVIQGLRFGETSGRAQSACFIIFGLFSSCGTYETVMRTTADLPQNITFRSNYIQTDPHTVTRRCMDLYMVGGVVRDNWIDCISPTFIDGGTSDSQAMNGAPVGTSSVPVLIENNYIVGATESIGFGTIPHQVKTPGNTTQSWYDTVTTLPNWIKVANNHVPKETYLMTANWTAATWYRVGQVVASSAGSVPLFIAITTGKTSGSEPNWAGTGIGSTVVDGGVTWFHPTNLWNNGTCSYSVKNHLETKSANNLLVTNNFMDRLWAQCAAYGNQGRSFAIEVQSSPNGGGSASYVSNVTVANNISTNVSGAIGTLYSPSTDDPNILARFMGTAVEPYTITGANNALNISVDGQTSVAVTLTTGARTAYQIVQDINAAGGGSATTKIGAVAGNWVASPPNINGACSGTECIVMIQRATGPISTYPYYSDSSNNPWNDSLAVAKSISPATGTTATTVLGLPANGTAIYWCTNPYSWVWYGCGSGTNINFVNNLFQMRHDGLYVPFATYISLANGGADGQRYDHNTFDDPTGWHSSIGNNNFSPSGLGANVSNLRWGSKKTLVTNNAFANAASSGTQYVTGFVNAVGVASDWTAINFGCQTAIPNATLSAGGDNAAVCDSAHLKGGFSRNLMPSVSYTNGSGCSPAAATCTTSASANSGYGAYPNDNPNFSFNAATFTSKSLFNYKPVYDPSSPQALLQAANLASDNRPIGVDMSQMNFVSLAGGAPVVSDRAAIFTFNVTAPIQGKAGMLTVATDPFCFSPVPDMDPASYTNPGWTDNDKYPQQGPLKTVIVGLNSALTASTPYYYCLEYQGYALTGTFTTAATLSSTRTMRSQVKLTSSTQGATGANNMVVEYGAAYSRATGLMAGSTTTSPVSCTVGGAACTVTFSATAGVPLYYRYKVRDVSNVVLITQPAVAVLPR